MIVDPEQEFRIYSQNCVDASSTIVSSHGGTTANLYDQDLDTYWTSAGAKRDTIPVTLTFTFKVGTVETAFTFNTLMLLRTNAKQVKMEWYDTGSSSWIEIFNNDIGVEDFNDARCFYFGAIRTSQVRVTIFSTQDQHNQEKYIGELVIARLRIAPSQTPSGYDPNTRDKKQILDLGNGERRQYVNRFTTNRTQKWGARISFNYLTEQDIFNLKTLKNEAQPFLVQPEAVTNPEEVYLVNWVNKFTPQFSANNKSVGYDLSIELEEV